LHTASGGSREIEMSRKANGQGYTYKIAGKFDGYSEAWSKGTFVVSSIKELMKLTEEYEGNQ